MTTLKGPQGIFINSFLKFKIWAFHHNEQSENSVLF